MIPVFSPGDLQRPEYCNVPFRDLLFRNFFLLFYMRPTVENWWQWYVVDDFGNLTRVDTTGGRHYRNMGDH